MTNNTYVKRRRIGLYFDYSEFDRNIENLIERMRYKTKPMMISLTELFVATAVRFTPPSFGKRNIARKYFFRPVYKLTDLIHRKIAGATPIKEDYFALGRNKMKYKVVNDKHGVKKGTAFAYTKSPSEAKRLSKIETRGLARVSWGKDLPSINGKFPNSIMTLLSKSPRLNSLNYNKISMTEQNEAFTVNISNNSKNIERIARYAEQRGYRNVENQIMREFSKVAKEDIEV